MTLHYKLHGSSVHTAKLTESAVCEIRRRFLAATKRYGQLTAMAREYGITPAAVRLVVMRRTWRHLL
jgi:hypothetical protein